MYVLVIFQRLEMCYYLSRLAQLNWQSLFQHGREPMRLSHGRFLRKQEVHFDDLAVSGRAIADAVIMQPKFIPDGIEPLTDLPARIRIGIVQ